jgi:hypothetical protein
VSILVPIVPYCFANCSLHDDFCSDAPALSTDQEAPQQPTFQLDDVDGNGENKSEWDDEALAVAFTSGVSLVTSGSTTAELGTLQNNSASPFETDDIAEKLKIEETKAQLAAARLGMERQAALLKEQKEAAAAAATSSTAPSSSGTSKWLPPHQRASGLGSVGFRGRMSAVNATKLDVSDAELFPDLHQAEKILEAQKPKKPSAGPVKKPGAPGGATWATKSTPAAPATPASSSAAVTEELVAAPLVTEEPAVPATESQPQPTDEHQSTDTGESGTTTLTEVENATNAAEGSVPSPVKKVPTKKKKKDLSTFKASA